MRLFISNNFGSVEGGGKRVLIVYKELISLIQCIVKTLTIIAITNVAVFKKAIVRTVHLNLVITLISTSIISR